MPRILTVIFALSMLLVGCKGGGGHGGGVSSPDPNASTDDVGSGEISQSQSASGGGSTTSGTFVDLLTVSITTTGGRTEIVATGWIDIEANRSAEVQLVRGATVFQIELMKNGAAAAFRAAGTLQGTDTPPSGSNTYKIQGRAIGGTMAVNGVLTITEFKR